MKLILPFFCLILLAGCITERSYYLSPLDANQHPYYSKPMLADSFKAATYASGTITLGVANQSLRDNVFAAQLSITRAHRFGNFQGYYGAGAAIGLYNAGSWTEEYIDSTGYYSYKENRSVQRNFSAVEFHGGMNYVIPFSHGEWRVIGFEGAVGKEFGEYVDFRKSLSDSTVGTLAKYSVIGTLGGTSEIIHRSRHGVEFGYKLAVGGSFVNTNQYVGIEKSYRPVYLSHALHLTKDRATVFWQANFATRAASFQLGFSLRL